MHAEECDIMVVVAVLLVPIPYSVTDDQLLPIRRNNSGLAIQQLRPHASRAPLTLSSQVTFCTEISCCKHDSINYNTNV